MANYMRLMLVLIFGLPGMAAQAASFDCSKARIAVEKQVCASPTLSKLDEDLAAQYRSALVAAENPAEIKVGQRAWLKRRNQCQDDACIEQSMRGQIQRLAGGEEGGVGQDADTSVAGSSTAAVSADASAPAASQNALAPDASATRDQSDQTQPLPVTDTAAVPEPVGFASSPAAARTELGAAALTTSPTKTLSGFWRILVALAVVVIAYRLAMVLFKLPGPSRIGAAWRAASLGRRMATTLGVALVAGLAIGAMSKSDEMKAKDRGASSEGQKFAALEQKWRSEQKELAHEVAEPDSIAAAEKEKTDREFLAHELERVEFAVRNYDRKNPQCQYLPAVWPELFKAMEQFDGDMVRSAVLINKTLDDKLIRTCVPNLPA